MYTRKTPTTVIIEKETYVADDGTEFSSKSVCEDYEKRKNGDRKPCDNCGGHGVLYGQYIPERKCHDSTGEWTVGGHYAECPVCHGKGYLDKKVTTTWE